VKINVYIFVFYPIFDRIILLLFGRRINMDNCCKTEESFGGTRLRGIQP